MSATSVSGTPLVAGVDAGATTTRCVIATLDGVVLGRSTAPGANPNSSGGEISASLAEALTRALNDADRRIALTSADLASTPGGIGLGSVPGGADPASAAGGIDRASVRLGVLGGAGSAGAGRAAFRAAAVRAWRQAGLTGEVVTVTDLEVAFAAGTAEPDGVLLLSGTGALAARFADGELRRRCDGYGWLLGDEGSAVWIGVRALRAVLAALDGRGVPTTLVDAACRQFGIPHTAREGGEGAAEGLGGWQREKTAQALIAAAFGVAPAELGRLAGAVSVAADEGDGIAERICAVAAERLLHTYDSVGPPPGAVVVLAGAVLLGPGPVGRAVRAG
ncbi:BadF/BadG/BcrA/BcrD ATPase family protein, partial [Actinoplanes sp. NPDC049596]